MRCICQPRWAICSRYWPLRTASAILHIQRCAFMHAVVPCPFAVPVQGPAVAGDRFLPDRLPGGPGGEAQRLGGHCAGAPCHSPVIPHHCFTSSTPPLCCKLRKGAYISSTLPKSVLHLLVKGFLHVCLLPLRQHSALRPCRCPLWTSSGCWRRRGRCRRSA